jgi:hypothetical protein
VFNWQVLRDASTAYKVSSLLEGRDYVEEERIKDSENPDKGVQIFEEAQKPV